MADMVKDLRDFHEKFGVSRPGEPIFLPRAVSDFRIKFMKEELDEYISAVENRDMEGQFDALLDLVYVALGTADYQGFPWNEGWNEVQRANMSKESAAGDPSKSKRGFGMDVIKPQGWKAPDIKGILDRCPREEF